MLLGAGESAQSDGAAASVDAGNAEPARAAEAAEGGDTAAADVAPADADAAVKGVSEPQPSGQGGTPVKNGRGGANGRERRPKVDVQRIAEVRQLPDITAWACIYCFPLAGSLCTHCMFAIAAETRWLACSNMFQCSKCRIQ